MTPATQATQATQATPATSVDPTPSTWTIDAAHTDILFSAKHMMVTTVRGTFAEIEGTLTLDETDPSRSHAELRIATGSVSTGNGPRDGHLRSPDFFDAEHYPWMLFRSSSVEHVRGDDYRIAGELTIRDRTHPITFDATFLGFYTSMQGGRRAGLSARTRINRKDWNLGWNVALETGGWLVGEDVAIEVEIAVDQLAEVDAAA